MLHKLKTFLTVETAQKHSINFQHLIFVSFIFFLAASFRLTKNLTGVFSHRKLHVNRTIPSS